MLVIVFLIWISAVEGQLTPCPIKESEIFQGLDNASVPETTLQLYTRKNRDVYQDIGDIKNIGQSNYNPNNITVIAIHGYNGNPKGLYLLKSAYLRYTECNFIMVNWSVGASDKLPFKPAKNVPIVAKFIANKLEELKNMTGGRFKYFHVIGWSLGGQLAGFVGKHVKSEKIGRITALDPAGMCFEGFSPEHKLHISDADFVDVILTNSGPLIVNEPTGHVTFAPDGGKTGRGCEHIENATTADLPLDMCSHTRAVELFSASLTYSRCIPVGFACPDYNAFERGDCFDCGKNHEKCAAMGIHAEQYAGKVANTSVMMYLDTSYTGDFCMFQYHVEVTIGGNSECKKEFGVMYLFVNRGKTDELEMLLQPSANKVQSPEELNPGEKYKYLIRNPQKIQNLSTLTAFWVSYENKEDSRLYIECARVIVMNHLFTQEGSTIYATGNNKAIQPEVMTSLEITSKC